jgi:zinc D-Ala-D-Ala dipeptidase
MNVTGIVPLSDPCIAAVAVRECGEPLVDIRTIGPLRVDPRRADQAGAYAHIRAGIVDRLVAAQSLLHRGLRLLIIEAYRPPALQERYFQEYLDQLRTAHPEWSPARLWDEASRYVAQPDVAPHVAGAAADLTLVDQDGTELPMGTPVNADPEHSAGACRTDAPALSAAVRANRRALANALLATGFVNHPPKWWQWSYGDRYWTFVTGCGAARYGPLPADQALPGGGGRAVW